MPLSACHVTEQGGVHPERFDGEYRTRLGTRYERFAVVPLL